jgi:hypothetical protein
VSEHGVFSLSDDNEIRSSGIAWKKMSVGIQSELYLLVASSPKPSILGKGKETTHTKKKTELINMIRKVQIVELMFSSCSLNHSRGASHAFEALEGMSALVE